MLTLSFEEASKDAYRVRRFGHTLYNIVRDSETSLWTAMNREGVQACRPSRYRNDLFEQLEMGYQRALMNGLRPGQPTSRFLGFMADEDLPIKPGDEVVVPAGLVVYQPTAPASSDRKRFTRRIQRVQVNHVLNGSNELNGQRLTDPKIVWAGADGYWCEVYFKDLDAAGLIPNKKGDPMGNRVVVMDTERKILGYMNMSLDCYDAVNRIAQKYTGQKLPWLGDLNEPLATVYERCEPYEDVQLLVFINDKSRFDQADIPRLDKAIELWSSDKEGPRTHLEFLRDLLSKHDELITEFAGETSAVAMTQFV